tara:strand:+ start:680 stop:1177 length:498 start_codon:yes stop_codon:yes gene_type:complete
VNIVVRFRGVWGLFLITLGRAFGRQHHPLLSLTSDRRGFGFVGHLRFKGSRVAKLSSVASRIGGLRGRVAALDIGERANVRERRHWRKWYRTARWRELRMRVFERDLFTCQWPGCGRIESDTSKLVADHDKAHRGDAALFWDEGNVQTLCKPCHDRHKQRLERRQ